jgi:hypothetical protein
MCIVLSAVVIALCRAIRVVCLHDVSMIAIGVEDADQGEEEPSHHHVAPGMSLPHKPSQDFLASWKRMTWDKEATRDVCDKRSRTAAWNDLKQSWGLPFITLTASEPPSTSNIYGSVEHLGDLDDPETKSAIMMRYDSHRKIIREGANSEYSLRTSPVLYSLVCLAGREYRHPAAWYSGTEPVQKAGVGILECRFCRLDLTQ